MRIVVDLATPNGTPPPLAASADGLLRTQDGVEDLRVSLRFSATRVSLWNGTTELGAWSVSDIRFIRRSTSTYEFLAEGEHLLFMPDDPGAFADFEVVLAPERKPERPKRTRRLTFSTTRSAAPPTPPADKRGPQHARPKESWSPHLRVRLKKNPPTHHDPAQHGQEDTSVEAAAPEAEASQPPTAEQSLPTDASQPETGAHSPAPLAPDPIVDQFTHVEVAEEEEGLNEKTRRAWLYAIDQARKLDLLGLDRVPVTTKMRMDAEHEHTWDHRVASGFATRHVCTICGRVRLQRD